MTIDQRLHDYAEQVGTTARSERLDQLDQRTRAELGAGGMLSGPLVGRLLETLVAISGATRVLEIGTFSGVSALTMAAALPPGGRLITLEMDAKRAEFARAAFAASEFADRIELREGPALDTLATLDGPFDVVFIDADKTGYGDYVDAVLPKLAPRGVIALDNMLLDGSVLDAQDERGRQMDALTRRLAGDPELVAVLLPVRDGVTLVRRRLSRE